MCRLYGGSPPLSIRFICELTGLSYRRVRELLLEGGVQLREPGYPGQLIPVTWASHD